MRNQRSRRSGVLPTSLLFGVLWGEVVAPQQGSDVAEQQEAAAALWQRRRTLQQNHNIAAVDGFLSPDETAGLLRLGRDHLREQVASTGAVMDAFARSAELPADGDALVLTLQQRVAALARVPPSAVTLTYAEGRPWALPGSEDGAGSTTELEYRYTQVVHDSPAALSLQIFLTEHFEDGHVLFPCHKTGAGLATDRGSGTEGSRLAILQSFLGGGRGLFAEGQRRWEPEYTTPAQSRTQRRELFKKAQEGRVALARSQYINSFCKQDWPAVGAHDYPLMIKPAVGTALLWASRRADGSVDPLAWHADCRATGGTEPKAVIYATVAPGPDAEGWAALLAPLGGSMLDEEPSPEPAGKPPKDGSGDDVVAASGVQFTVKDEDGTVHKTGNPYRKRTKQDL